MLKPEIAQLLGENESAYSLVIAIAKRSRAIAERAEQEHIELPDKAVNLAIDEFGAHKWKVGKGEKRER